MMTPQNKKAQGGATTPTKGKARTRKIKKIEQVESNTEHLIQSTLNHYDEDGFLKPSTANWLNVLAFIYIESVSGRAVTVWQVDRFIGLTYTRSVISDLRRKYCLYIVDRRVNKANRKWHKEYWIEPDNLEWAYKTLKIYGHPISR